MPELPSSSTTVSIGLLFAAALSEPPLAVAVVTALQSVHVAMTEKRREQFELAIQERLEALRTLLNTEYVKSEAFASHMLQALRAVEVAENKEKVVFIASGVLGCAIQPSETPINRQMCLRVIEQATMDELRWIAGVLGSEHISRKPKGLRQEGAFVKSGTDENALMVDGCTQLGLLTTEPGYDAMRYRPSVLAEHIFLLCQDTNPFKGE